MLSTSLIVSSISGSSLSLSVSKSSDDFFASSHRCFQNRHHVWSWYRDGSVTYPFLMYHTFLQLKSYPQTLSVQNLRHYMKLLIAKYFSLIDHLGKIFLLPLLKCLLFCISRKFNFTATSTIGTSDMFSVVHPT